MAEHQGPPGGVADPTLREALPQCRGDYGLPAIHRSKHGYLCVEAMVLRIGDQSDPETGEALTSILPVLPTHYKCPRTGVLLPVEDPTVWLYHDEEHP